MNAGEIQSCLGLVEVAALQNQWTFFSLVPVLHELRRDSELFGAGGCDGSTEPGDFLFTGSCVDERRRDSELFGAGGCDGSTEPVDCLWAAFGVFIRGDELVSGAQHLLS